MKRPFVTLCIFLFIGIFLGYKVEHLLIPWVLSATILVLLLILVVLKDTRYTTAILAVVLTLLGLWLFQARIHHETKLKVSPSSVFHLIGEVKSDGVGRGYYVEYDIVIMEHIDNQGRIKIGEKAKLQITGDTTSQQAYGPGDRIDIEKASLISSLEKKSLGDYEFYLRTKGYRSMIRTGSNHVRLIGNHRRGMQSKSYASKRYVERYFDEGLSPRKSDLLKSILFGNQGYMTKEDRSLFAKSGTAHIVAVSGLHIGILVVIMEGVLGLIGLGRNSTLVLTAYILFCYAYVVNFPVSIIRAGVMYALYLMGYFLHRRYDSINGLMFVAWIIGIYSPLSLFTVSFQLSFVATLSIVVLYPIVKKWLKKIPKYLAQLLAVTLAAQIGTAPILAYHFGSVSLIALVANMLIVPILGGLLALALGSVFLGLFSTFFAGGTLTILEGLLGYMYWVVEKSSQLPFSSIEITRLNGVHILLYYGVIGVLLKKYQI